MPNPVYRRDLLLWSTQGGGVFNSPNPAINGQGTIAPLYAPPASALNAAAGSSELMDVSGFRELFLHIILTSFTGGVTPTFTPEWDILDDNLAGAPAVWTPNAIPLWKPAAASAATKWAVWASAMGLGAAPTITGYTAVTIPTGFGNLGKLAWTTAGAPTAVTWSAFIYGKP